MLARSRIALNRHIDLADGYANNMRLYEATGVGALLVTEAAPEPGRAVRARWEVVAYEDEDDLVEKLRHYLADDEERRRVAAAGQARTLREHTYANRIGELAAMLERRRCDDARVLHALRQRLPLQGARALRLPRASLRALPPDRALL